MHRCNNVRVTLKMWHQSWHFFMNYTVSWIMILDIDVLLDTVSFIRTLPVIKHWFLKHLWMSDPWVFLDPVLGQHLSKTWWPAYRSWARLSLCHCWCVILMQNISQQQNMWTTDETPIKYIVDKIDKTKTLINNQYDWQGKISYRNSMNLMSQVWIRTVPIYWSNIFSKWGMRGSTLMISTHRVMTMTTVTCLPMREGGSWGTEGDQRWCQPEKVDKYKDFATWVKLFSFKRR